MCSMQPDSPPSASRADRLTALLTRTFSPIQLRVLDDSARHAGHAGHDPAGETHYDVLLVSEAFRGRSRVDRARAVHDVLQPEFAGGMHAINLTLRTPEEHSKTSG
jgi:stress-induced morphogen